MAVDMEYVNKALIVVLDDDDHGRPVLHWDRIRAIIGDGDGTTGKVPSIHFTFHLLHSKNLPTNVHSSNFT
jgi:hypothetical protein